MTRRDRASNRRSGLARRLSSLVALCVVTAVGLVSVRAHTRTTEALEHARIDALDAIARAKEVAVVEAMRRTTDQVTSLSRLDSVRALLAAIDDPSRADAASASRAQLAERIRGTAIARVVVTNREGDPLATSDRHGSGGRGLTRRTRVPEGPRWALTSTGDGTETFRLWVPVRGAGGIVGGLLADVRAERIWNVLLDRTGLGASGETYLLARDGAFVSPAIASHGASRANVALAERARQSGGGFHGEWTGYRGVPVVGSVVSGELRSLGVMDAFVVCEVRRAEVLGEAVALRSELAFLSLALTLGAVVVALIVTRRARRTLSRLVECASRVADGDLGPPLRVEDRDDELGLLVASFAKVHEALRAALDAIRDGTKSVSTHTEHLTANVRRHGALLASQAASVASTSTSLAETRRGSAKTAEAARGVLESTEAATAAGRRGLDALDAGVEAMGALEARVRGIASEALELSQQSARIGQIVATVNDLSEQSNVLAVNASVEAAKAGDRGKGFAVVAQEVRRLAEQSKRATQQIRRILGDVQRAVESVVMAAEEGTKRSEDGRRAIDVIRSTVNELATTLDENADSARRIASSASEQATGIAQLSSALEAMERTAAQSTSELGALERSRAELDAVVRALTGVSTRYDA